MESLLPPHRDLQLGLEPMLPHHPVHGLYVVWILEVDGTRVHVLGSDTLIENVTGTRTVTEIVIEIVIGTGTEAVMIDTGGPVEEGIGLAGSSPSTPA